MKNVLILRVASSDLSLYISGLLPMNCKEEDTYLTLKKELCAHTEVPLRRAALLKGDRQRTDDLSVQTDRFVHRRQSRYSFTLSAVLGKLPGFQHKQRESGGTQTSLPEKLFSSTQQLIKFVGVPSVTDIKYVKLFTHEALRSTA